MEVSKFVDGFLKIFKKNDWISSGSVVICGVGEW
jgi:hypothetical protein